MATRLAVTVGDPAGIGPEVVLKALARADRPAAEMIVYGPASVLRERVTSKGGTTAAALQVMAESGVKAGIVAGCMAAAARGQELGKILGAD